MKSVAPSIIKVSMFVLVCLGLVCSAKAEIPITKKITIRPILVRGESNPALAGDASQLILFEQAADKIWKQAGVEILVLPMRTLTNDAYLNISTRLGDLNSASVLSIDFTGSGVATARGNGLTRDEALASLKVLNVWFVRTIGGSSSIGGTSLENGPGQANNGIVLANSATTSAAIGALAHEIGHALGLSHTSAAGDSNNLMGAGSTIHTSSLANIEPDGLRKYKLNSAQVATALGNFFVEEYTPPASPPPPAPVPPTSPMPPSDVIQRPGSTGLQFSGLLAASDTASNNQIAVVSDILSSVIPGKNVAIHFLAYSYVQGAVANVRSKSDFAKATKLIQTTLPRLPLGSRLILMTSLDDGQNRKIAPSWTTFRPDLSHSAFWTAVAANDAALKAQWKANVAQPFKEWSDEILAWASAAGHGAKLQLEVSPVFCDALDGSASNEILAGWTKETGLHPSITFFRNPALTFLSNDGRSASMARIEFRRCLTSTSQVDTNFLTTRLRPGYVVSNDDALPTPEQWQTIQKIALEKDSSACHWLPLFIGGSIKPALPPYNRGPLPDIDATTKFSLIAIIRQRFGM